MNRKPKTHFRIFSRADDEIMAIAFLSDISYVGKGILDKVNLAGV